ncbi:hypothetical protein [Clostridium lundense]|uniref:hypothetical protein n=1 Tax=Clostridium lundense TaxID=319475 RepID=UPI000AD0574A|nr:hypothetical protein [Clostridium lundense]
MIVKCEKCGKEFDAQPVPQTKCGTMVCSQNTYSVSTVNTVCPECTNCEESKDN